MTRQKLSLQCHWLGQGHVYHPQQRGGAGRLRTRPLPLRLQSRRFLFTPCSHWLGKLGTPPASIPRVATGPSAPSTNPGYTSSLSKTTLSHEAFSRPGVAAGSRSLLGLGSRRLLQGLMGIVPGGRGPDREGLRRRCWESLGLLAKCFPGRSPQPG